MEKVKNTGSSIEVHFPYIQLNWDSAGLKMTTELYSFQTPPLSTGTIQLASSTTADRGRGGRLENSRTVQNRKHLEESDPKKKNIREKQVYLTPNQIMYYTKNGKYIF